MNRLNEKWKKLIAIFVIIISLGVSFPTKSLGLIGDFGLNISGFIFGIEKGIISFLNNIFCDDNHDVSWIGTTFGDDTDFTIYLSAESIISGKFIIFDANIFEELSDVSDKYDGNLTWITGESVQESKNVLRTTIAGWYYSLFNFSIVALLSVLVYVGIRMTISTISQDKAKYKVMFKDWLVAICILVMMHYMMIGILNVTSMITTAIGGDGNSSNQVEQLMEKIAKINELDKDKDKLEIEDNNGNEEIYTVSDAFAMELVLACIIIITGLFVFKYLKREFIIIFLILLGPISCITYPIDKISDGKAQAFNKWFSEFLYNVLIQPFHLLLYTVLVSSAVELANNNIIYAICCLAVLIPAEKFVKEMFGFRDKLGSPLSAMATGAMAGQVLSKAFSGGGKTGGSSGSGNGGGNNQSTENQLPPKTKDDSLLTEGGEGLGDNADAALAGAAGAEANRELNEGDNNEEEENQMSAAQGQQEQARQLEQGVEDGVEHGLNEANEENNQGNNNIDEHEENNNLPNADDNNEMSRARRVWNRVNNSKPVGFIKNKGKRALDVHNQRMAKKWGSPNRGQRWINRGKKLGIGTLKKATKATGTLAGAALGGTLGLMTGQGAKGALAGAALGSSLSDKTINKVSETGKDYARGMSSEASQEKEAINDGIDEDEIRNLKDEASRGGNGLDSAKYRKLLEKRIEENKYSRGSSKKDAKKDTNQAIERTKQIAASRAKYTSKLSDAYSAKDFRDEKVMGAAQDRIMKGLKQSTGINDTKAEQYARDYIEKAAKLKGVSKSEVALPPSMVRPLGPRE